MGVPIVREINQWNNADASLYSPEAVKTYMKKLADATCCFSVVTYGPMVKYLTGRGFEVMLSGSLLVQEYTPMMHRFFTPGEHYLEFRTVAELSSIMRFITERPEEAEAVRRCGNLFARAQYCDEKMIGQIDAFFYH